MHKTQSLTITITLNPPSVIIGTQPYSRSVHRVTHILSYHKRDQIKRSQSAQFNHSITHPLGQVDQTGRRRLQCAVAAVRHSEEAELSERRLEVELIVRLLHHLNEHQIKSNNIYQTTNYNSHNQTTHYKDRDHYRL